MMNDKRTTRWHDKPNDEDTAVEIFSEQFPKPIAKVLSYSSRAYGPGRHERDRYARLIAAAPELLQLSRFLIERLDDFERDPLQEDDGEYTLRQFAGHVSPAIERLRAAIAAAEVQS